MSKVPITTKGIKQIVKTLAEAGVESFQESVKVMKDQDGIASGFDYTAEQVLRGAYAVASDGQLGLVLHAVPAPGQPMGGDADVGYEWQNRGDANVELTISVRLYASDKDAADGIAPAPPAPPRPSGGTIGR